MCACLSNRQCGCLILIKKNDKCGGKIKFQGSTQLLAWNVVLWLTRTNGGSRFTTRMVHTYHKFFVKQSVWIDAVHFLWCKRLSPVTLSRNVSPQPMNFKCRSGNSSKLLHKSKKFRRLCCHLSQRLICLRQMISTSHSARVAQPTDKIYSLNN